MERQFDTGVAPLFLSFYEAQFGALASFAQRQVGDGALADELAQEAMGRVYAWWPLLRHPLAASYRAAARLIRDHVSSLRDDRAPWTIVTTRELYEADYDHGVDDLVNALPTHLRAVVVLHHVAALPVDEVAKVVRRPLPKVIRQVAQARELLERHKVGRAHEDSP